MPLSKFHVGPLLQLLQDPGLTLIRILTHVILITTLGGGTGVFILQMRSLRQRKLSGPRSHSYFLYGRKLLWLFTSLTPFLSRRVSRCGLDFPTWVHGAFLGQSPRDVSPVKSAHWLMQRAAVQEPPQVSCHTSDASHMMLPLLPWMLPSFARETGRWEQGIASNSEKINNVNLITSHASQNWMPSGYQLRGNSFKRDQGEAKKM